MSENVELSLTEQLGLIEKYEQMVATRGWDLLVEDMTINRDTIIPHILRKDSNERDLQFAKGRHDVLSYIIGFKQMVAQLRENLELQIQDEDKASEEENEFNAL